MALHFAGRALRGCALMLLATLGTAIASVEGGSMQIHAGGEVLPAMPHLRLLEDASRNRTLDQVRSQATGWSPTDKVAPGFSHSVWWLRVAIENPTDSTQRLVLDLGQPLLDHVRWFVVDRAGHVLFDQSSGDRVAYLHRPIASYELALPLTLAPHEWREVFIRLNTHDGLYDAANPMLYEADGFAAARNDQTLLHGLYFGALLALTIYNLLVWISTRNRAFGLYVLYAGSFFIWSFTFRGFAFAWLWPNSPNFNNQILAVTASTSFVGFALFGMRYLRLAERAPHWQVRTLQGLIALNLVTIPLAVTDHYAWAFAWCVPVGLAIMAFVQVVCFDQVRRGAREGWLYGGSFLPLGIGASFKLLQIVGLAPHWVWLDWVWQAGSAFEMLFLAICLADAMNQLRAQTLQAERTAREAQTQLATGFEQQVRERTLELEAVNQRLGELSITDALTGAFNRRHFDQRCREMLRLHGRAPAPLSMCMIDLDHFKAFNDHHGHQAGDRALTAVVAAVKSRLKRQNDQLFRLGGEEFGVLFGAPDVAHSVAFAEELRQAIRGIAMPHAASPAGIVTASFGLAHWRSEAVVDLTPERMYAEADRLLYEAKAAGRDRIVVAVA